MTTLKTLDRSYMRMCQRSQNRDGSSWSQSWMYGHGLSRHDWLDIDACIPGLPFLVNQTLESRNRRNWPSLMWAFQEEAWWIVQSAQYENPYPEQPFFASDDLMCCPYMPFAHMFTDSWGHELMRPRLTMQDPGDVKIETDFGVLWWPFNRTVMPYFYPHVIPGRLLKLTDLSQILVTDSLEYPDWNPTVHKTWFFTRNLLITAVNQSRDARPFSSIGNSQRTEGRKNL